MCVCDAVFLLGNLGMVGLVEMGGPPVEVDMSKGKAGLTLVLLGCQIFLCFFNPAVDVCDIVSPETCLNCGRETL